MNARLEKLEAHRSKSNGRKADHEENEIDISLLEDSLARTPWERMQANDDALRFSESLRAALKKRNATTERADAQTG